MSLDTSQVFGEYWFMTASSSDAATQIGGIRYQLINEKLKGETPIQFIDRMRASTVRRGDGSTGPPSFREVAEALSRRSGVSVTYEAVRTWWHQARQIEADAEDARQQVAAGPPGVHFQEPADG